MGLAPLHALFHKGFLSGQTSYNEHGKSISLRPASGETVLLFKIDGNGIAAALGLEDDKPRCDAVLLYFFRKDPAELTIRLIALELKGGKHCRALDQLDSTLDALKKTLAPLLGPRFFTPPTIHAAIITNQSSPQQFHEEARAFEKKWGFAPKICKSGDEKSLRRCLA